MGSSGGFFGRDFFQGKFVSSFVRFSLVGVGCSVCRVFSYIRDLPEVFFEGLLGQCFHSCRTDVRVINGRESMY